MLPTGTGKTILFASVIEHQVKQDGRRALILAHRGELLDQAADKLMKNTGIESALERAENTAIGSMFPVTVGSVQSMMQPKRLAMFPNDYYSDIIVDEAHHVLSDSYQRVLEHFPNANILGVTATPDRGDKKNLGTFFDSQAFEYTMREAIRDGYLVPIKAQMIPLELDINDVSISNGDYSAGEISSALDPFLELIAKEMVYYCAGRKTVVFLPMIATSQKFCRILTDTGMKACEVNGKSKDREEIIRDFESGKYDVLCNSMLLTEGWDCPAVDCIVVLRPTENRALYQQMVGRGMRLFPGKDHLLILDFLWLTERHDLCRPSSLISKDEKIAARINEKLWQDDRIYDLLEVEEAAEKEVIVERENALAKQLSEMRNRQKKLVDPMQFAQSIMSLELLNYEPMYLSEMAPATQKQLDLLEKFGISASEVQNKGMAKMILDQLISRRSQGLTTPKQIRTLEKFGFQHVGTWKFSEASRLLDIISLNGWKVPQEITPAYYLPTGA